MDDMLKDFVVESLDLATNVEALLLNLERNPEDMDTLNAVFRSFHTIKGGAGFMGLPAMVSACHLTENLFDALEHAGFRSRRWRSSLRCKRAVLSKTSLPSWLTAWRRIICRRCRKFWKRY
jgi:Chemotaxis protein histidine kinase and related kinases